MPCDNMRIIRTTMHDGVALKGLYTITDSVLIPEKRFFAMVQKALDGGARIIQFRDKRKPDNAMLEKASALLRLCESYNAVFIVNDHVELAVRAGAHGLHIGEEDADFTHARNSMKDGIIGVSCYNSIDRAVKMEQKGADYVAFGSFFPSPVKPEARRTDIKILSRARQLVTIPVCAIGGITAENAGMLVQEGADMVAVITDIWTAPDIRRRAAIYAAMFDSG